MSAFASTPDARSSIIMAVLPCRHRVSVGGTAAQWLEHRSVSCEDSSHIACVFQVDTKCHRSFLPGVYARESKRPHTEGKYAMDSISHEPLQKHP